MSETLEQRLRNLYQKDEDSQVNVFAGDVIELLNERDERIEQLLSEIFDLNMRITELENYIRSNK